MDFSSFTRIFPHFVSAHLVLVVLGVLFWFDICLACLIDFGRLKCSGSSSISLKKLSKTDVPSDLLGRGEKQCLHLVSGAVLFSFVFYVLLRIFVGRDCNFLQMFSNDMLRHKKKCGIRFHWISGSAEEHLKS